MVRKQAVPPSPPVVARPEVKEGHVTWLSKPNLEVLLNENEIAWEFETGVRLADIEFGRNPSRLMEKVDATQVDDIAYKIIGTGLALPALLAVRRANGSLFGLGGHHRQAACKEAGVKTASVYVVSGVGADTEYILALADNRDGGRGISQDDGAAQCVRIVHEQKKRGIVPDFDRISAMTGIPAKSLHRAVALSEFRARMTQPETLVLGSDKLPDPVVEVLAANAKLVNEPVLIEAARCLARFKSPTGKMATDLLRQVKSVTPKTEEAQRSKIAEVERAFLADMEVRRQDKGKKRSLSTDAIVVADLTRFVNSSAALDAGDPRDLLQGDRRDQFLKQAVLLRARLTKIIKVLEGA